MKTQFLTDIIFANNIGDRDVQLHGTVLHESVLIQSETTD